MTLRLKAGNKSVATEKQEQAAIIDLLRSIGASVYVLGTVRRKGDHPGTMQTPGLPDLFAFIPYQDVDIPLWIEVKRRGGKLSEPQREFHRQVGRSSMESIVGGVDDVLKYLQECGLVR